MKNMNTDENLRNATRRAIANFSRRQDGLVELNEASLAHVLRKQGMAFVVISACWGDWAEHNGELAADLKDAGIGYTPVWGGYVEDGGNGELERSFLAAPMSRDRKEMPFGEFIRKMARLGTKYRQETILVAPPDDGAPYCLATTAHKSSDTGKVVPAGTVAKTFNRDFILNDLLQSYFTSLNKVRHPSLFELAEGTGREFKAYIPGDVRCYSDRYGRWLAGTIFGSPEPFGEPL